MESHFSTVRCRDIIGRLSRSMQDIRYLEDYRSMLETALLQAISPTTEAGPGSTPAAVQVQKNVKQNPPVKAQKPKVEPQEEKAMPVSDKVSKKAESSPINETAETANYNPAPDPSVDIDMVTVKHRWPSVIARLKQQKKIRIAAYLMEGVPVSYENNELRVAFKQEYRFHCEQLKQPDHISVINRAVQQEFKTAINVVCNMIDQQDLPPDLQHDVFSSQSLLDNKHIPDKVKKVVSAFDGEIVS